MSHKFSPYQRVKFASTANPTKWFRCVVDHAIGDGFYTLVDDGTGRPPRIVRSDRLLLDATTHVRRLNFGE